MWPVGAGRPLEGTCLGPGFSAASQPSYTMGRWHLQEIGGSRDPHCEMQRCLLSFHTSGHRASTERGHLTSISFLSVPNRHPPSCTNATQLIPWSASIPCLSPQVYPNTSSLFTFLYQVFPSLHTPFMSRAMLCQEKPVPNSGLRRTGVQRKPIHDCC